MTPQTSDHRVNPCDETIRVGRLSVHILITAENSNGTVFAFELFVPSGKGLDVPAHSHDHYEETIYGIDGVLRWMVDRREIDVGPGQVLCIRRGAVHRFDNTGSRDGKALVVITPAAIGPQYFREIATVVNAGGGGARDHAKLADIMRRHGLTPVPASNVEAKGLRHSN